MRDLPCVCRRGLKDKVPKKRGRDGYARSAFDVQENSRLSCQITITPDLDGLKATSA